MASESSNDQTGGEDFLGNWVEASRNNSLMNGSFDAYYGVGGKVGFNLFGEKAYVGVHLYTVKRSLETGRSIETKKAFSGLEFGIGPVSLSWIHNWDHSGTDFGFSLFQISRGAHENVAFDLASGYLYLLGGVGGSLNVDLGKFIYEASPVGIPEMEKTFHSFSDKRLKNQLESINSSLYKVNRLNGYAYKWIDGAPEGLSGSDLGLIAQEVEAVFPEVVQIDDSSGYKTISYYKLIPVLVEAIKEQQKIIEDQEQLIMGYEKRVEHNEKVIEQILLKLEAD